MSDSIGPSGEARRLLPDSVGSRGLELEDGRERARFWRLPDLHGLEVLHATYLTHTFARHTHDGFVVGIIERGVEAFYYRGATRLAPAGSIVVVEPGEMHTGQAGSRLGWTYRVLYPEAVLLQRAAVALGGSPDRVPSFPAVIEDPALYALFQQLHATLDGSASALERESGLTLALARLVARHGDSRLALPSTGRERGAVELVRHYLETHYGENPSLDELARLAGLSPFRSQPAPRAAAAAARLPHRGAHRARKGVAGGRLARGAGCDRNGLRRPEPPHASVQASRPKRASSTRATSRVSSSVSSA